MGTRILHLLSLLTLALWWGGMVFFSFIVTPRLFQVFSREMAGDITAALFPRYYLFGILLGAVVLALKILAPHRESAKAWMVELAVILMLMGTLGFSNGYVRDQAHSAREAMHGSPTTQTQLAARSEFRKWHGVSMALNLTVLLGLTGLVGENVWMLLSKAEQQGKTGPK